MPTSHHIDIELAVDEQGRKVLGGPPGQALAQGCEQLRAREYPLVVGRKARVGLEVGFQRRTLDLRRTIVYRFEADVGL